LALKLARETKAASILQLSLYSELPGLAQGMPPEAMYVVRPGESFEVETYHVADYAACYRYVKGRLSSAVLNGDGPTGSQPEPTTHCVMCRWYMDCDGVRRRDDHLSLVAGISRLQRKQLEIWETRTVETRVERRNYGEKTYEHLQDFGGSFRASAFFQPLRNPSSSTPVSRQRRRPASPVEGAGYREERSGDDQPDREPAERGGAR
jgi:predicted RecB family nuclease